MAQGRKPKPAALRELNRNAGKREIQKVSSLSAPGSLNPDAPPDWLDDEQKNTWKIGLENAPRGVLKKIDTGVYLAWVISCARFKQANELLQIEDLVSTGAMGGPIQNPLVQIANKQAELMIKAAGEMGFTPASRTRVNAGSGGDNENRFNQNGKKAG
jgi:P27 family predicted phage terminase small subunit